MPTSSASCTPSPSASRHTRSPRRKRCTKPASNVRSLTPQFGVAIAHDDVVLVAPSTPSESAASSLPASARVGCRFASDACPTSIESVYAVSGSSELRSELKSQRPLALVSVVASSAPLVALRSSTVTLARSVSPALCTPSTGAMSSHTRSPMLNCDTKPKSATADELAPHVPATTDTCDACAAAANAPSESVSSVAMLLLRADGCSTASGACATDTDTV
jgi:hypothetical protein